MDEGVDVSWVQGNYRPGGEAFVIVNASRANVGLAVGSYYRQQVANARAAGKHVGHYFFNGNIDPTRCAEFFAANLDYRPGDSLWLDVESEPGTGTVAWSPGQALAFVLRVQQLVGVVPGIYLNRSLMDGYDWSAVVAAGAPLWIAYYNSAPPPIKWWPTWTLWQYASTPMDLDRAQGSLTTAASAAIIETDDDEMISTDSQAWLKSLVLREGRGRLYYCATPPPGLPQFVCIFWHRNPGEHNILYATGQTQADHWNTLYSQTADTTQQAMAAALTPAQFATLIGLAEGTDSAFTNPDLAQPL